jgi:hypothetical protein
MRVPTAPVVVTHPKLYLQDQTTKKTQRATNPNSHLHFTMSLSRPNQTCPCSTRSLARSFSFLWATRSIYCSCCRYHHLLIKSSWDYTWSYWVIADSLDKALKEVICIKHKGTGRLQRQQSVHHQLTKTKLLCVSRNIGLNHSSCKVDEIS